VSHPRPGFLYNVSWEVCNRIGGVHTVLETAAPHLTASCGKQLLYVGPDLWAARAAHSQFREDRSTPPLAHLAAERGVPVRFGRWDIEGEPRVALLDFGSLLERKNAILGDLWDDFGVDSSSSDTRRASSSSFTTASPCGRAASAPSPTSISGRPRPGSSGSAPPRRRSAPS
jgi:phosphorylase/glycogen(starch) synthase